LRGRKTASLPFFAFRFLLCKNLGNLFTPASVPAIHGGLKHWSLSATNSIYPSTTDSNGNSGILPPPFGRNPASMPFFAFGFCFAKLWDPAGGVWGFAPNSENQNAQAFWFGIHAAKK
jgi:hypothetical protein